MQKIVQRYPGDVLVIDVQRKPKTVIGDIDKCEFIISSSLHGLVVADSLGIANAWMLLSENVLGQGFKFFDYASAFGLKSEPRFLSGDESLSSLTKMTRRVASCVHDNAQELDKAFRRFRDEITAGC